MSTNKALMDELMAQLQGPALGQIANQLGVDEGTTQRAVGAALPMLLGALGRNTQQTDGAAALLQALQRDHSGGQGALDMGGLLGSLLGGGASAAAPAGGGLGGMLGSALGGGGGAGGLGGLLGSLLGGGQAPTRQLDAGGILGHILGGAQPRAESSLGQRTGLNAGQSRSLLMMLAPMLMSMLSQRVQAGGLSAQDLSQMLGQESAQAQQQGGMGGDLMTALLDQDGDGKVDMNDLMQLGSKLLGGRR